MGHFPEVPVPGQDPQGTSAGFLIGVFFHFPHGMLSAYVFQDCHVSQVCLGICDITLVSRVIHPLQPLPQGTEKMIHDYHKINNSPVLLFIFPFSRFFIKKPPMRKISFS